MTAPLFHLQPDQFLDTAEGQNWLAGAVDDLIDDTLYVSNVRVIAEVMQLEDALADHVGTLYSSGGDHDGALGQVIRNVMAGDIDKAQAALNLLLTKEQAREIAEEFVRPLAQKYADSRENDDD